MAAGESGTDFTTLSELDAIVRRRLGGDPGESYTAKLGHKGAAKIAQKLGEEAVETAIEAVKLEDGTGDSRALASESADLLYHLLVLWAHAGLDGETVMTELRARMDPDHKHS